MVLALAVALGVLAATGASGPVRAGTGSFTHERYTGAPLMRDYWLYVPANLPSGPRPLVVFLHGCNQTAVDAAKGTRWNEAAERFGFLVVYPEQRLNNADVRGDGNGIRCWNWFDPDHQARGAGEPATIAAITRMVTANQPVDSRRVYLVGISAGADMATNLAATYPELWGGLAILAGCAFRTCSDVSGRQAYEAMGDRARPMPTFVVQGTVDVLNPLPQGMAAARQWLGAADWADDGATNGSVAPRPATTEHRGVADLPERVKGTGGDPCARSSRFPCVGGAIGLEGDYPVTVERYVDGAGRLLEEVWIVHGLGHAYPGGHPEASYTDPLGPDVTTGAWRFLSQFSSP